MDRVYARTKVGGASCPDCVVAHHGIGAGCPSHTDLCPEKGAR
jgi:hypothetical protein